MTYSVLTFATLDFALWPNHKVILKNDSIVSNIPFRGPYSATIRRPLMPFSLEPEEAF